MTISIAGSQWVPRETDHLYNVSHLYNHTAVQLNITIYIYWCSLRVCVCVCVCFKHLNKLQVWQMYNVR